MKRKNQSNELKTTYTSEETAKLNEFFKEFNLHCLLNGSNKKKMREDLENAISYYRKIGVSLSEALKLLSNEYMGGFYAKPSNLWFPLDDAAKIYPTSLGHGKMSLFRLSVYLKKDVVPELLQIALTFTIKRFPTFATTIKKGVFWHYLDTVKRRYAVEQEIDAPVRPIPVSKSCSQSFRVIYFKNRISVEFFHVLTDGSGGVEFIKCLTAEYLRLTGVEVINDGSLLDVNETPKSSELADAFKSVPKLKTSSGLINKPSVQLSGKLTKLPCRILHFKMDTTKLKSVAKKYGVSISVFMLAVMFKATKSGTEQYDGYMSIQVPVNMRKFYPSDTLRNFSMYCAIRIPLNKDYEFSELLTEIDEQLKVKADKQSMSEMLTSTENLINSIKLIPLIIKNPVSKIMYGVLGDKAFSNTLSNLGIVNMPACCLEHIESMDFVLGTSVINRASSAMITINNTTTFSITKKTLDPSYEETMYKILVNEGITVDVEGSDIYEN